MNQLVRFDTNSINRALLGFDTLFNDFEHRFANQINQNYPPYNILKRDDDTYEIEIAVTGFAPEDISVKVDQNQLIIEGVHSEPTAPDVEFLHRSLASRDFSRNWTLAEHMEVGEGRIKNGVLTIELKRVVPDSLKPRVLKIKTE